MITPYWTLAIERARVRVAKGKPAFTERAKYLAGNWVSCACGRQDIRLPRGFLGRPEDYKLYLLGDTFCNAVLINHIDRAERTLAKIEIRAAEVIAGELA